MADFRAGRIHGLVAVHKLAIGTDAPDATIAVSARPSRSIIVWIQYVGRLMRTAEVRARQPARHRARLRRQRAPACGPPAPILERWPEVAVPATAPSRRRERPTTGASAAAAVRRPSDGHAPCRRAGVLSVLQAAARARAHRRGHDDSVLTRYRYATSRRRCLRLAQDRACRPPLDGGESARKWAWMQVRTLTGRRPRDGWPPDDWRERDYADPHPVVRRTVKRNGGAYREWMSMPET